MTSIRYQVGGALLQDVSSYVTRDSDRQLLEALKAGEFCYVLNSRQMGKSSLMVRTLAQLQEAGWKGIILDFSAKDTQSDQPSFWYNGIINQLNNHFKLLDRGDFRTWLKERDFISPVERLGEFIETVLLPGIIEPIVIFVDEIDSTLGLPFTDDFFALIRACYNRRAEKPDYKRLTFALLGVAAPSELIGDTKRTPFNIGKSIDLSGFTLAEAQPLASGLAEKSEHPQVVLEAILFWTGGQPFLSQRLCQLVADANDHIIAGSEAFFVEGLVRSRLIENWESQDQQEHLKTIRRRVIENEQKAGYLLELYRQIRQAGSLPVQNRPEEQELQLSGLVVKREGNLQVYNPIYAEVFNESWIDGELAKLRPYSDSFRAWIVSGRTDNSRLLRGGALKEAEQWAKEKNPSAEDQDFLSASRTQEREEEIAIKERDAELERERQDKETAERANKLLRKRALVGTVVLFFALAGAFFLAVEAKKQVDIADVAKKEAKQAKKDAENANQKVANANKEVADAKKKVIEADKQVTNIKKDLESKKKEANRAEKAAKDAKQKAKNAKELAQKAQGDLTKTQAEKDKLSKEAIRLQEEANRLGVVAKQAEENAKRATIAENRAVQATSQARQAELKARRAELEVKASLDKTNQALNKIKALSKLAAELRKKGKIEASNELSTRVTSSVLIEDYELKRIWLLATQAQANQSLDNSNKEELTTQKLNVQELNIFKESLDSLKKIPSKNDQEIFNQVTIFAYFMAGQLLNKKEYYQSAYDQLKSSKFDLYDSNTDNDILIEKDVESIHRELINSILQSSPEKDKIRASLKEHLLAELNSLMKQQNWRESDRKDWAFILFIANREKEGYLELENIKNFSCPDLKTLDNLWVKNSNGKYGYSVIKKIWLETGNSLKVNWNTGDIEDFNEMAYNNFYDRIGWKEKGEWLTYEKGMYGEFMEQEGHLPSHVEQRKEMYYTAEYFQGDVLRQRGWLKKEKGKEGLAPTTSLLLPRLVDCNR
jgi:hypothetical protein